MKPKPTLPLAAIACALVLFCALRSAHAAPAEIADRAALVQYVSQPIADTPRNQRYLAFINKSLDDNYLGIDTAWFQKGGGGYISRTQTAVVGELAFCYHTKGLKYFHDPRALEKIQSAFDGVISHISAEGKFTWTEKLNDYGYDDQQHEHAWRLEPLILAVIWVGDDLGAQRRTAAEAALLRASAWMAKHPLTQHNNRGTVWCAVTTFAGLYFDRQDFRDAVEKYATEIITQVVLDDGESGEHTRQYGGGGPDSNYSYTGWAYVYLYRAFSGRHDLDDRLQHALRWFAAYNTRSGCGVVCGASVRKRYSQPEGLFDLLPALERYSHNDPFFAAVADRVMSRKEKYLRPEFLGHLVSPFIWAMFEKGVDAPPIWDPKGQIPLLQIFDREQVHYALISRAYQSGITFRGRTSKGYNFPLRGVQAFAWGEENPILLQTNSANSSTKADGINTATTNIDKSPDGWEILVAASNPQSPGNSELSTITTRTKTLWTVYAFTPAAMVVIHGGTKGELVTQWVIDRKVAPPPRLDNTARIVTFEGRHGVIHFLTGQARLTDNPPGEHDDPSATLEVVTPAPQQAFAFSDESFHFGAFDAVTQELDFRDKSGHYVLSLNDIVDGTGNLKRPNPLRLRPSR